MCSSLGLWTFDSSKGRFQDTRKIRTSVQIRYVSYSSARSSRRLTILERSQLKGAPGEVSQWRHLTRAIPTKAFGNKEVWVCGLRGHKPDRTNDHNHGKRKPAARRHWNLELLKSLFLRRPGICLNAEITITIKILPSNFAPFLLLSSKWGIED